MKYLLLLFFIVALMSCDQENETQNRPVASGLNNLPITSTEPNSNQATSTYPDIDFSDWKLTLPVDENNNGSPDEYQPAALINNLYRTNTSIKPYMYDDIEDASIVFYTFPASSTSNSSYSRTELRELIEPSNARINWSLSQGGMLRGKLKMDSISQDSGSSAQYHKTIVMQIHGIISLEDMETYGFSSNNGPPLIKIYWKDGYIWSHKKSLVNEETSGDDLLDVSSNTWTDIKENLGYVGFEVFDFKITASEAKIEVQLNDKTPFVYEDTSLKKWPFENYFKAGNYLGTRAEGAFSYVKYYELEVSH